MKEDLKEKKRYGICFMIKNNEMVQVFGRIGLQKFIEFSGRSGWKKGVIGGSGVESHGKND